ncbi:hypothetical protein PENTCL1PPCAC_20423, partial [Pristionchus entomophagus]
FFFLEKMSSTIGTIWNPQAKKLTENVIVLQVTSYSFWQISVHIPSEETPFLYVTNGEVVHVLDTATMEFLPRMQAPRHEVRITSIMNVHKDMITVEAEFHHDNMKIANIIMDAHLPNGY